MGTTVGGLLRGRIVLLPALVLLSLGAAWEATGQSSPAGDAVMALALTIAPTWFDPSTAPPQIPPVRILYTGPDAGGPPVPGQERGKRLAGTWAEGPEGRSH